MTSSGPSIKLKIPTRPRHSTSTSTSRQSANPSLSPEVDEAELEPVLDKEAQRVADSKKRHEEDVKSHKFDAAPASKPEDDWQIAYVWAFITKFNLRSKIPRLETLEDFERCLTEPVANRPDDVLEGTLMCFLGNLKPGLRNLTCENIQSHVSNYITDMLTSTSEWTVWDRGWPINEEPRGGCCLGDEHRLELGRLRYHGEPPGERAKNNPIRQAEERGEGLFELGWKEKAKLLRQMVDWQLNHSENIRAIINREYRVPEGKGKKAPAETSEGNTILVEPLGQNRDRARVWSLDNSWRLYKSGNPYKRPCPLTTITTTRTEYESWLTELDEFTTNPPVANGTAKGRESAEQKKIAKGVKDEKALKERARARIEEVEKEEARVQRARKRIAQAVQWQQQAEIRSTRTRRQAKKVDYIYDDSEDFDDEPSSSRRASSSRQQHLQQHQHQQEGEEYDHRGRPVIPGERRSARMSGRSAAQESESTTSAGGATLEVPQPQTQMATHYASSNGGSETASLRSASVSAYADGPDLDDQGQGQGGEEGEGGRKKKRKSMKGFAWVEEVVPFERLSAKEKEKFLAERAARVELEAQAQAQAHAQVENGNGDGDVEVVVDGEEGVDEKMDVDVDKMEVDANGFHPNGHGIAATDDDDEKIKPSGSKGNGNGNGPIPIPIRP